MLDLKHVQQYLKPHPRKISADLLLRANILLSPPVFCSSSLLAHSIEESWEVSFDVEYLAACNFHQKDQNTHFHYHSDTPQFLPSLPLC